jgi:hypothetical protein
MRKRNALTELYSSYPTKEQIENDFSSHLYDTWCAVHLLHGFLEACHKDGLLMGIARSPEKVLKDLAEVREWLGPNGNGDFELDLKPDHWTAETATATAQRRAKTAKCADCGGEGVIPADGLEPPWLCCECASQRVNSPECVAATEAAEAADEATHH